MEKPIYIIGHKSPDTDSVCSAIAYSNLKNLLGFRTEAYRAGKTNSETKYVLDYFHLDEPKCLPDVYTRARDLLNGNDFATVTPSVPVWEAWKLMRKKGVKTLPVVDASQHLLGLVTVGDFADKHLAGLGEKELGNIRATVGNVVETLSGNLIVGEAETKLDGPGIIGAMRLETMESSVTAGSVVIVGDRGNVQRAAIDFGAKCLIVTEGVTPRPEVLDAARSHGTSLITVDLDTFTAARLLLMSIPVESIMHTHNLVVFQEDDLLDEVKKVMLNTRFRNYPVVDELNRVVGEISRYHLLGFSKKKVILVDHNEFSQSVDGIHEAQVMEVIDHHRVGGFQTGEPIMFRNEPVGATCTLIAKAYMEKGITPSTEMAGIMCAGILSDTVVFKSPTCTEVDKEVAAYLGQLAGIDPIEFGVAMFKHSSSLAGRSPKDIVHSDFKEFSVGDFRVGIGQVNIMNPAEAKGLEQQLKDEMDRVRQEKGLRYVMLMVTDLLAEGTWLVISGQQQDLIGSAFGVANAGKDLYLEGVLSRKKQVVPPLVKFFEK